jgi:hypothetical protein
MSGNIVWILGAGFSILLGGPWLVDLLSAESQRKIRAAFPDNSKLFDSRGWEDVKGLLAERGWEHLKPPQRGWQHAEEFLEHLDLAATRSDSSTRRYIQGVLGGEFSNERFLAIAAAAKRVVAAECCFFRDPDLEFEKWNPYCHWAKRLLEDCDTVISFNYDRVVEAVTAREGRPLDFLLDSTPEPPRNAPKLLKLHGSVDWKLDENGSIARVLEDPCFALTCKDSEIAIAIPGPSKFQFGEQPQINKMWHAAREAVMRAATKAVVFIGYRFPPTDAFARDWLLMSLTQAKGPDLAVHAVLGPTVKSDETRRLEHLLRYALHRGGRSIDRVLSAKGEERAQLRVHPMYGQDYLSLVRRSDILKPPPSA